jgi:hypothetical protein
MTEETNFAITHPLEFEQGKRSCLASVSSLDAPYEIGTKARNAWDAGFDSVRQKIAPQATVGSDQPAVQPIELAPTSHGNWLARLLDIDG